MNTVSADRTLNTASAPVSSGLSAREECTALALAITIRARIKLAQAYASLYEGWVAEDQVKGEAAKGAAAADAAASPPGRPDTAGQPAVSPQSGQRATRTRRKPWPHLLRRAR